MSPTQGGRREIRQEEIVTRKSVTQPEPKPLIPHFHFKHTAVEKGKKLRSCSYVPCYDLCERHEVALGVCMCKRNAFFPLLHHCYDSKAFAVNQQAVINLSSGWYQLLVFSLLIMPTLSRMAETQHETYTEQAPAGLDQHPNSSFTNDLDL